MEDVVVRLRLLDPEGLGPLVRQLLVLAAEAERAVRHVLEPGEVLVEPDQFLVRHVPHDRPLDLRPGGLPGLDGRLLPDGRARQEGEQTDDHPTEPETGAGDAPSEGREHVA